jgi:oligosaccharide repeat unit polymerase
MDAKQSLLEVKDIMNETPNLYQGTSIDPRHRNYLIGFLIVVVILVAPLMLLEYRIAITVENVTSLISFLAIGIWAIAALFFTAFRSPFSLNCSHWVFVLLFFFYVPLLQFLLDKPIKQTNVGAFKPFHLEANLLILSWLAVYTCAYYLTSRRKRHKVKPATKVKSATQVNSPSRPQIQNYSMLILLALGATIMTIYTFGWEGILMRGAAGKSGSEMGAAGLEMGAKPLWLIVNIFCRALPMTAMTYLLLSAASKKRGYYATAVLVAPCALLINSPLAVARFWFGALGFGLVCILLRKRRKLSALWFPIVFYSACIVIMPYLNIGRMTKLSDVFFIRYLERDAMTQLLGSDFDGTQMFTNTIKYVKDGPGLTYGNQLLGAILFPIPRAIWKDKADGSGKLIGEYFRMRNTNLSNTLPAEGYLNFGVVGVLLFAGLFAVILARLDQKYWEATPTAENEVTLLRLTYPFLVGFVIYIMRGDMLSSFSYTTGFVTASWLTLRLTQFCVLPGSFQMKVPTLGRANPFPSFQAERKITLESPTTNDKAQSSAT